MPSLTNRARRAARVTVLAGLAGLTIASSASAATFTFATDPFAGTNVLTTPGRQVLGGEFFISFDTATDTFALDRTAFGLSGDPQFANAVAPNLPADHVNVVVLESLDDDNNALTPFGAGNAANLIAAQVTESGPGFFIYFNQSLDLPRLVFSSDLSDSTADLRILFRMLNLNGATGRNALPTFTASNFTFVGDAPAVPEPAALLMMGTGLVGVARRVRRRQRGRAA